MLEDKQAQALFHAEVESLSQIRHRNVVSLYGWCREKGKLLLVYEYMSNGTLNDWLHKNGGQKVLSLKMRHSILEGIGAALEYLHEDCLSSILHRDIKSTNVLLDANFKAYIGDFGLARLIDHHKLDKTTLAAGTFGYMAPELPYTGKATKESDVYSFGILVLEVVCGRPPLDLQTIEPEDLVLLFMVWKAHEGGSLFDMADPRMLRTFEPSSGFVPVFDERLQVLGLPSHSSDLNCKIGSRSIVADVDLKIQTTMVVNLLQLGLFCCLPNPKARPSMREVNRLLQQIQDIEYESPIMTTLIPSLPATKPLGLYDSLEFSCNAILSTSIVPSPTSLV